MPGTDENLRVLQQILLKLKDIERLLIDQAQRAIEDRQQDRRIGQRGSKNI